MTGWSLLDGFAVASLVLAAIPFGLSLFNVLLYRAPPSVPGTLADSPSAADPGTGAEPQNPAPDVSILIPARDEEGVIEGAVRAALASRPCRVEVLVMDDGSSDATAEIVGRIAKEDRRLRLLEAPPLPAGWAGKQHACYALARQAAAPLLIFVDADVELGPDAVARIKRFIDVRDVDLASGFPRQITGSFGEKLIIPLIHFVLLGYLPLLGMRLSNSPGFAAGCGQLMAVRRRAYRDLDGHAAIKTSFHDGIQLPRAFRRSGRRTDLFDATGLAVCRMYDNARDVVLGLAKNAHEGMAGKVAIWVWSVLLLGGAVLPWLIAAASAGAPSSLAFGASIAAVGLGLMNRLILSLRFRQSLISAVLHPLGIAGLVAIQWYARWRRASGRTVTWKNRGAVET